MCKSTCCLCVMSNRVLCREGYRVWMNIIRKYFSSDADELLASIVRSASCFFVKFEGQLNIGQLGFWNKKNKKTASCMSWDTENPLKCALKIEVESKEFSSCRLGLLIHFVIQFPYRWGWILFQALSRLRQQCRLRTLHWRVRPTWESVKRSGERSAPLTLAFAEVARLETLFLLLLWDFYDSSKCLLSFLTLIWSVLIVRCDAIRQLYLFWRVFTWMLLCLWCRSNLINWTICWEKCHKIS